MQDTEWPVTVPSGVLRMEMRCEITHQFGIRHSIRHRAFHSTSGIPFGIRHSIRHRTFHSASGIPFGIWHSIRHPVFHRHSAFHSASGIPFGIRHSIRHPAFHSAFPTRHSPILHSAIGPRHSPGAVDDDPAVPIYSLRSDGHVHHDDDHLSKAHQATRQPGGVCVPVA
jgi:hypothetical protein